MQRLSHLLTRFRKDERGVFMVLFAVMAIVLIATSGAVVDFSRIQQARTKAQTALDAASLALQAQLGKQTGDQIKATAQSILTERVADSTVTAVVDTAVPDVNSGKLTLTAHVIVPTYFVQFVGVTSIRSNLLSEVTRSSSNLEIALSIDITGSMARKTCSWWDVNCTPTDKIGDLINASNLLIDTLVLPTQVPTYSRMAIVPWSAGVNVDTYAESIRGPVDSSYKSISSSSSWSTGSAKNFTSITRGAIDTVISSTSHGFAVNDWVYIQSVSGLTRNSSSCINGGAYKIKSRNTNSFTIGLKTDNCTSATSNTGNATKCLVDNCDLTIRVASHGKTTDSSVYITNANSGVNGGRMVSAVVDSNRFALAGVFGPTATAVSSGRVYCGENGCNTRVFTNPQGNVNALSVSTCVSERTTNAYNNMPPSTTKLGYNYPGGNQCPSAKIQPLTDSISTLKGIIGPYDLATRTLVATGSTAGHLGLAWGWYMVSPSWGYLWPDAKNKPAAYTTPNTIKAIVFMTDGDFNTPFNSGLVASDAIMPGAGSESDHINQPASNGASKAQAQSVCDEIKKPAYKTILYVVGFDLANNTAALDFLRGCATSVDHFYRADTGTDLQKAFKDIAGKLSELRVSR